MTKIYRNIVLIHLEAMPDLINSGEPEIDLRQPKVTAGVHLELACGEDSAYYYDNDELPDV